MKKTNKTKWIIPLIVILVVGIFIYSTQISDRFTMEDGIALAEKHVPKNSTLIEKENDHRTFDITFANDELNRIYEFEINKARRGISAFEISSPNEVGGNEFSISEEDVKSIIDQNFNHITDIKVFRDYDDGKYKYETSFKSKRFYGEAKINGETGRIMELEISYLKKAVPSDGDFNFDDIKIDKENPNTNKKPDNQNKDNIQKDNTLISLEKAKSIVLKKLPDSTIVEIELDQENGIDVYEGETLKNNFEYEFEIDATTGNILKWQKELND